MSWFVTGKAHYTQFAQVEATDKSELLIHAYAQACQPSPAPALNIRMQLN